MSFDNPTPLRIGATGTLHGWRVRIVGRVVLGMEDEGETYYWQEFNVVDEAGTNGTLVCEETEDGPEWKLFTLLEPAHPITAADAAGKRVGDVVNLDGKPTAITLVDESRVYHIEGTAPEGVQVGDVANYFNADAGERMLVGSWTGEEIEFYEGRDLTGEEVAQAFGVASSHAAFSGEEAADASSSGISPRILKIVGLVIAVAAGGWGYLGGWSRPQAPPPPAKRAAPAFKLATGAQGSLGNRGFTVAGQAVVEVARVGARHECREYQLRGDGGEPALLINALHGASAEWLLFQAAAPPAALAGVPPYAAAAQRRGATVSVDGRAAKITHLFAVKPRSLEGDNAAQLWPPLQYGFVAREGDDWIIARWTESAIQFFRGRSVAPADITAAFPAATSQRK